MSGRQATDYYESAGGLVVYQGRMLLVRKRLQPEIRMPKGHIEPGESREAAALREVREETGYATPRILADLGTQTAEFERFGRWTRRAESAFLMALDDETAVARDAKDSDRFEPIWVAPIDAPRLLTFRTEQEFARRALAWLAQRRGTNDE